MADYVVKGESLTSIADAIREKTGGAEKMALGEMPAAVGQVFEAGKQAQYDAFWDVYQQNGNRSHYNYAFSQRFWTDEIYNPKYPMVVSHATAMFQENTAITDTKVPINFGIGSTLYNTFRSCSALKTIREIKLLAHLTYTTAFMGCSALENLTIAGEIGQNGFSVADSTLLTHESLMSILGALKDYSGTGTTCSVTLGTENLAKLTDEEKLQAVNKGWTLVGWTPPAATQYCSCGAPLDDSGKCTEMNSPGCEGWEE